VENGYSMIYGSYWDAAVITELTDGKVKSVPVEPGRRKHPIQYSNWLSDGVLRDPAVVAEKKVAVVANFELGSSLGEDNPYGATEVFYDNGYTVYEFPDPAVLAKDLQD